MLKTCNKSKNISLNTSATVQVFGNLKLCVPIAHAFCLQNGGARNEENSRTKKKRENGRKASQVQ